MEGSFDLEENDIRHASTTSLIPPIKLTNTMLCYFQIKITQEQYTYTRHNVA